MLTYLDLLTSEHSYLFGFLQGDGHLYRNKERKNKGLLSVELSVIDRPLLEQFQRMFPFYSSLNMRQRDTNFRIGHEAAVWSVSHQSFRDELAWLGLPCGRKATTVEPPKVPFSKPDYFRGLVDADGSLGLEKNGLPFLSLTTGSDAIACAYMDFLFEVTGKRKQQGRNQRDRVYNILVFKEDAQTVVNRLYYDGCLALPRKAVKAREIMLWARPASMKLVPNRKAWTPEEDAFLLTHTLQEAMDALGRNYNSVNIRRGRLRRARKSQKQVTD